MYVYEHHVCAWYPEGIGSPGIGVMNGSPGIGVMVVESHNMGMAELDSGPLQDQPMLLNH